MTCIVGIVEKDKVYIGGDSAGVGGLDITIRKDNKVFKVGEFVIGCTSSFRMIQLLRYSFNPPKQEKKKSDVYEYMCTVFVNSLRKTFTKGGFLKKSEEVETGGVFLVGYRGRLFRIEEDYQVGESIDLYDACGCGESYAKGALRIMVEQDYLYANQLIIKALETATYFSGGVRPPFIIEYV